MASGGAAQAARGNLCPKRDGEEIERGQVGAKGARGARLVTGEGCSAPRIRRESELWPACGCGVFRTTVSDVEQGFRQDFADKGAGTDGAFDIALGTKLLEGVDDGAARERVLVGEVACSWQPRARSEVSAEDLGTQCGIEPAIGRDTCAPRWEGEVERSA